jgi:xylulokinase
MSACILAHDLGTTGNKATLFSLDGTLTASVTKEYPTHYPQNGWVEQNPEDWWRAVCESTRELLEKSNTKPSDVACICFSAQMMGCLLVDKVGTPLHNMLIWADTRSGEQEAEIIRRVGMERMYKITGHRAGASYSAAKLLWLRDYAPSEYKKASKLLNAKDYILFRMTGHFVTDYSDASGTNLMDLAKMDWSQEILEALEINPGLLPQLHASTDIAGKLTQRAADDCGLLSGTPVVIGGGDGSCACVGAGVVKEGSAYNVLGSSSWISTASRTPVYDRDMRTFTWVHLDKSLYTPCGTMQAAGYSYRWFRDALCNGLGYDEINALAKASPAGANGTLFLPYLLGERSPRWDLDARGAYVGLSVSTSRGDMARAVMEGVALNLKIILDILMSANPLDQVTVIGGGAKGGLWLQILADVWQKPLQCIENPGEATSMGAAVCGGVGIGAFDSFADVKRFVKPLKTIQPNRENARLYEKLAKIFESAYLGLRETDLELQKFRAEDVYDAK